MSLILYGAPLSPFVRKVRLCLLEKALPYQLEVVLPTDQPAWFFQISPLGRIPALRDGDLDLADSSVICHYLEQAYPQTQALLGHTAALRAQIHWFEKYADYELAPLTTRDIFVNRCLLPMFGKSGDESKVQYALNELPKHFDYLEKALDGRTYLVDEQLSLADIALYSQLQNMQYGGETLDVQRWPALSAHFLRIQQRSQTQSLLSHERSIIQKHAPQD